MIRFLHLSDTHFLKNYNGEFNEFGVDYDPHEKLNYALSLIDYTTIDFVVITGDLIHDGGEEDYEGLDLLLKTYIPQEIPMYYCLGNHDNKQAFHKAILKEDSSSLYYYEVFHNGYRLLILDTSNQESHDGEIKQEQEEWIIEKLKVPSEKGTLIFQHHPLLIGWEPNVSETRISNTYIEHLCQSDVRGIFTGHLHENRHVMVGNIPQHTAAALSFGLTQVGNRAWFTDKLGYSIVSVDDETVDVFTETTNPLIKRYFPQIIE